MLTSDEEEQLWASGELFSDTPNELLAAMFYYNVVAIITVKSL